MAFLSQSYTLDSYYFCHFVLICLMHQNYNLAKIRIYINVELKFQPIVVAKNCSVEFYWTNLALKKAEWVRKMPKCATNCLICVAKMWYYRCQNIFKVCSCWRSSFYEIDPLTISANAIKCKRHQHDMQS